MKIEIERENDGRWIAEIPSSLELWRMGIARMKPFQRQKH
jgi:hypothetical protein